MPPNTTANILTPEERVTAALGLIEHLRTFTVLDPERYLGYLDLLAKLITPEPTTPQGDQP